MCSGVRPDFPHLAGRPPPGDAVQRSAPSARPAPEPARSPHAQPTRAVPIPFSVAPQARRPVRHPAAARPHRRPLEELTGRRHEAVASAAQGLSDDGSPTGGRISPLPADARIPHPDHAPTPATAPDSPRLPTEPAWPPEALHPLALLAHDPTAMLPLGRPGAARCRTRSVVDREERARTARVGLAAEDRRTLRFADRRAPRLRLREFPERTVGNAAQPHRNRTIRRRGPRPAVPADGGAEAGRRVARCPTGGEQPGVPGPRPPPHAPNCGHTFRRWPVPAVHPLPEGE